MPDPRGAGHVEAFEILSVGHSVSPKLFYRIPLIERLGDRGIGGFGYWGFGGLGNQGIRGSGDFGIGGLFDCWIGRWEDGGMEGLGD